MVQLQELKQAYIQNATEVDVSVLIGDVLKLIFGTDGIRGIANQQISSNLVFFIGKTLAIKALENNPDAKIIVGKDTRISSDMIECAFCAGVMSVGVNVLLLGLCTTPCLSFLTNKLGCDFGIMITASHNPANYNGIKIFNKNGIKLLDKEENELMQLFGMVSNYLPTQNVGKKLDVREKVFVYIDYIIEYFKSISLNNVSIAIDCANGAGSHIIPYVFKTLFENCEFFNTNTSGVDINGKCGSVDVGNFVKIVEDRYDFGIAFDGDADRLVVVLKNGTILDGDVLLFLFAKYLKNGKNLKNNSVVATILTNNGVETALHNEGIQLIRSNVGDKYVVEQMIKNNLNLGVEQSGHIVFGDINKTSDGLVGALMFLTMISEIDILKELKQLSMFAVEKINISVNSRQKNAFIEGKLNCFVEQLEEELGEHGRIIVRPSGTESVIRVLVEGEDCELIKTIAVRIKKEIEKL